MNVNAEQLAAMSEIDLLRTHAATIAELKRRKVVRTRNNPIGDYSVWIVCRRLSLKMESNPSAPFEAIDAQMRRYKIKGRREESRSVQLSVIRNLQDEIFEFLISVVFNNDYSIRFAASIPYKAVVRMSKFKQHVNGHILTLTDDIVQESDVSNITDILR